MTQFSYRQKGVCRRRMRLGIGHLVDHLAESRLDFGWDPANQPTPVYSDSPRSIMRDRNLGSTCSRSIVCKAAK